LSEHRRGLSQGPSLAAGLLFGVLGFAGNWFKLPLFSSLDFAFGSFFVMIAVMRHGIGTGVLASLIASSCTLLIWKHPWGMLILTAEAAFVGWRIARRGRSSLLVHDIVFWCCCGIPLTMVLPYVVPGVSFQFTLLICAKQLVNNTCNALLASIFNLIPHKVRRHETSQLPTLNQIVFTIMVSMVLAPALILILTDIRKSLHEESEALSQETDHAFVISKEVVSLWLNDQNQVVQTLAKQVGDPDRVPAAEMQRLVENVLATSPGVKRMGILNRKLVTTAYFPLRDELGRSTIGRDYSDRTYLKTMRDDGGTQVGDVVMSRIGKPSPVVVLIAPLTVQGVRKGVAIEVVRIEEIRKYLRGIVGAGRVSITILDRLDQVVASTRDDLPIMTPFRRNPKGSAVEVGSGVTHWTPPAAGATLLERQKRSLYIKQGPVSPDIPWKVVVESPYEPVLRALQSDATFSLGMLALLIVIVVPLSQVICRRLTADLETLREETQRLPLLVREGKEVTLPSSNVREVAGVIDNFRETCAALAQQYQSLDSLNSGLERRVEESETRFKMMFENHAAVMLLIDPQSRNIVAANRTATRFYGYPGGLRGMSLSEINCLPPEELKVAIDRIAAGNEIPFTATHRLAGGETRTVEVYPTAVDVGREKLIFSIVLDVTQQRMAEKALADYRESLEQQVQARTASLSLSNRQLESEIEERKRSERQLRAHQRKLSDLAMELTMAEERERNRIAGELHDQVGQRLLLGKMKLELLAHQLEDREREKDAVEIRCLLEQTLHDIRSLTFQMRPPILATAGLESAVQWLAEELEEDYQLQVECLDDGSPKPLAYEIRSVVFQAVRELLLNVVKHAGTRKATVSLRREGEVVMVTVADDGVGMSQTGSGFPQKKEGGFGLFNLQQRIAYLGGRLTLDSLPGEGTRVTFAVPLDHSSNWKEETDGLENYVC